MLLVGGAGSSSDGSGSGGLALDTDEDILDGSLDLEDSSLGL